MVNLPWLEQDNYSYLYPQYGGGGTVPGTTSDSGNNGDSNNILAALLGRQPSAAQSIASSIPFLGLPGKQQQYFQPAQNYANAATDINNPLYQQIYGQQKQQGQQNLADQISELSNQNRKLSSMGRTPLFDPERGGEQLFRGITSGYQNIQNQAANDTRGILNNASSNAMQQGQMQAQLAANKAGIKGNLLGSLTKLFGL